MKYKFIRAWIEKYKNGGKMRTKEIREVMDVPGIADYLAMSKGKIYWLIKHKKIPVSKIGRQYRFSKTVIDSWLIDLARKKGR